MRRIHVPQVNGIYWGGILLASVFGTNLGDYYAHESGLGIIPGLLVLAFLTLPLFILERFDGSAHTLYYWLVIVIIRTGATNIADYLQFRVRVPQLRLCLVLAALIALFGYWQQRLSANLNQRPSLTSVGLPDSGPPYWLAMLGAGVFGTVLGDVCSHVFGQGTASIGLGVLLALSLTLWRHSWGAIVAIYWLTVAVARTTGTAIGDWLAESKDLNFGLAAATVMSGIAFAGLLLLSQRRQATATPSNPD